MKQRFLVTAFCALFFCCVGCGKIQDGTQKHYSPDGKLLSETEYKNFRKNGPFKEYYPNGQVKIDAFFKNGKLHGTAKAYDETGNLIYKEMYQDGEIVYQNKY